MTTANDPTQELERRIEVLENYLKEHVATKEQVQQIQTELRELEIRLNARMDHLQEDSKWIRGKVDDLTASVQAIREHFGI